MGYDKINEKNIWDKSSHWFYKQVPDQPAVFGLKQNDMPFFSKELDEESYLDSMEELKSFFSLE
jgi:hypothetical protein